MSTETEVTIPEPTIIRRERSITARYDTGTVVRGGQYDSEGKILLTLSVSYHKAGINYFSGERTPTDYFSVSVVNETQRGQVIGFTLGSGTTLARIEQENNRFSKKKLNEIFDAWKIRFEGLISLDEHMLDDDDVPLSTAITPYLKGLRAGIGA